MARPTVRKMSRCIWLALPTETAAVPNHPVLMAGEWLAVRFSEISSSFLSMMAFSRVSVPGWAGFRKIIRCFRSAEKRYPW